MTAPTLLQERAGHGHDRVFEPHRIRSAAGNRRAVWAVEGTRHYGLGLARHLSSEGEHVSEIDCSRHVGKRRAGKSDPIDAVRAARELLARPRPAQMRSDGDREALRLLMTGPDNAIQSAKTARTALAAILVTAPAPLRERLRPLPRERRTAAPLPRVRDLGKQIEQVLAAGSRDRRRCHRRAEIPRGRRW